MNRDEENRFQRLYPKLLAEARRQVSRSRVGLDPEDLVSTTYRRAVSDGASDRSRWSDDEHMVNYFRGSIKHRVIDEVRRRRVRKAVSGSKVEPAATGPRPSQLAQSRERQERVAAIVAHLPQDERNVLREIYENNLSLRETARVLGQTFGWVRARWDSARRALEARLPRTL